MTLDACIEEVKRMIRGDDYNIDVFSDILYWLVNVKLKKNIWMRLKQYLIDIIIIL